MATSADVRVAADAGRQANASITYPMNGARHVTIIGAGVAGLTAALELSLAGAVVDILERGPRPGPQSCGWFAGGMLSPWYERADTDPLVMEWGQQALEWWPKYYPRTVLAGTLVVARPRDRSELQRYAQRTSGFEWLDADGIAGLEPDLAGRFQQGLFFAREGHLDPRQAVTVLVELLTARGVTIHFGTTATDAATSDGIVLDCRGPAARDALPELRGVRGEMAQVKTHDIHLSRPVRLLHPRTPMYVIPRDEDVFMLGGTVIESDEQGPVTARSAVELLNGAYAIHPAFGEAQIMELGVGIRPALPDNLPHLILRGRRWYLNGLFRHGFLLSPAMARQAAQTLLDPNGVALCTSS
ncbi:MAG: FAD-dependent oxidoreductase [Gammaproteobacteria bacterium]